MTDTGQVPGEGLPENAGMVEQPGIPAPGAYTFLDPSEHAAEEDDLLLMPGAQGAWSEHQPGVAPAPPVAMPAPAAPVVDPLTAPIEQVTATPPQGVPVPQHATPAHGVPHEPVADHGYEPGILDTGAHEAAGRDSGSVDLSAVRMPGPATAPTPPPARRPLHMGPPLPDATGGVVRSLADRGPAAAPVPQPAPVAATAPTPMPVRTPGPPTTGPEYLDVPQPDQQTAPQGAVPWTAQPQEHQAQAPAETVPPVAQFVPVEGSLPSAPHLAPTPAPEPVAAQEQPAIAEPVVAAAEPLVAEASDPDAQASATAEEPQPAPAPVVVEAAAVEEPVAEQPPAAEPVAQEAAPQEAVAPEPAPQEAVAPDAAAEAAAEAVAEEAVVMETPAPVPAPREAEPEAQAPAEEPQPAVEVPAEVPAGVPAEVQAEGQAEAAVEPVAEAVVEEPAVTAEAVAAEAPVAEAPVVEPAVVEPAVVEAPVVEPAVVEAPVAEAPAEEPAPVPAPEEPVAAAPAPVEVAAEEIPVVPDGTGQPQPEEAPEAPQASAAEELRPQHEQEPRPDAPQAAEEAPAEATAEAPVEAPVEAPAAGEEPRERAPGYDEAEREAVLRVMRERRDIRNGFRPDPIPHEVLLRVLEAAHTAPSVGHSQPWDFVVIRSAETRRTMHELAQRQREAYAKSLPKGRAKQFKELKIEAILDTPVNIVVTADPTRGGRHTLGRYTQPQMAPYSSALAVENLWLAARAEGLGVGWVSFFDEREMVRALGLPDHLEVVAYLCVGYVDEFPEEPELMQAGWSKRRPLSWVVHEETYGRRALPGEEPHDLLQETVANIRPLDAKALGEAWERQKRMTKPAGALGMLEIISAQLCGLSRVCPPPIPEPAAVAIFAGDHGVHAQGVTAWPQEVTGQMVANFLGGGAVCNAFANQVGAEVCVIDVGVASDLPSTPGLLPRKVRPGTADFTIGQAMTHEEAIAAIEVGIETARDLVAAGNKALLTGEMGIANTTASAALISVYTGVDPAEVTGRGTGINDEMHARKVDVVRRALDLHKPDPADPIGVLAALGGLEHAALVGLILGAASLRTPVILDGVSTGAAALVARAIAPESLAACIAGHRSAEPGHVAALNKLGLRPLVDLDLRLGEGTGALLALPVVQSAARAMHEVATFDSAGVTEK
ncbi:nicotinate-nucleotide--dimethylbenzimidazole phosphoribosyltransferase [Streptomyces sp. NPDC012637]|uniref:nicotinate-nucleotide--dimethylbenzimidazole phosphoribosyltransferase n=1 Tax=Streptomyces sp. NPDC012637 TaxID=3364842 RepID=UPI0036E10A9E